MRPREEVPAARNGAPRDGEAAEMARYGIVRVPADTFHYRQYRYARLSDAVAQAKRDASAGPADPK